MDGFNPTKNGLKNLSIIILAGLLIRLLTAFTVYGAADMGAWRLFADFISKGNILELYAAVKPNYSPLIPLISYFTLLISNFTGLPFWGLIKIPSIMADCACAALIYLCFLKWGRPERTALKAALLFCLNPVSIMVTSVHGQFDPFVIFFCLLAWFFHEFKNSRGDVRLSALFLGIAALAKNYPVILLPLFLLKEEKTKDRLTYAAITAAPTLLFLLPFMAATPQAVLDNVVNYSSRFGHWGYMLLLNVLYNHSGIELMASLRNFGGAYGKYPLLICFALYYYLTAKKRGPLLDDITSVFLIFYSFTAGFGIQYLAWIVPFAALKNESKFKYYTLFAGLWMLFWYMPCIPGGLYALASGAAGEGLFWKAATAFSLLTWAVSVTWLFEKIRRFR
jgi:hypothetical protein